MLIASISSPPTHFSGYYRLASNSIIQRKLFSPHFSMVSIAKSNDLFSVLILFNFFATSDTINYSSPPRHTVFSFFYLLDCFYFLWQIITFILATKCGHPAKLCSGFLYSLVILSAPTGCAIPIKTTHKFLCLSLISLLNFRLTLPTAYWHYSNKIFQIYHVQNGIQFSPKLSILLPNFPTESTITLYLLVCTNICLF